METGDFNTCYKTGMCKRATAMTVYSIYEEVSGGGEEDWNQPTPRLSRCALSPPVCSWSKALFGNAERDGRGA